MNAQDFQLDYFKVYRFYPQTIRHVVKLRDQFNRKRFKKCQLEWRTWFANPVSKNNEPLFDKNAHLVRYSPRLPITQPPRVAEIENQFGEAKIFLGDIIGLLVPARKRERGSTFPDKLDHYMLYEAHGEQVLNKSVHLRDQFDRVEAEEPVRVFQIVAFAVPVEKRHDNKKFPILNDRSHLTLYSIERSRPVYRLVYFEDQFGWFYTYRFQSYRLGVPSAKLGWNEEW